MNHGTASPPAKKDFMFVPVFENNRPIPNMNAEKKNITIKSKDDVMMNN
jgi:hypothetical protein